MNNGGLMHLKTVDHLIDIRACRKVDVVEIFNNIFFDRLTHFYLSVRTL